jgi:polar amino acid transport system ATP-binding protein
LLTVRGLGKRFGDLPVLADVDLDLRRGSVMALIGPSGSGKSTLLRCINALEDYQSGEIRLSGRRLSYRGEGAARQRLSDGALSAERVRVGMVFQSYTLFPHLNATQNLTLGLRRVKKLAKAEAHERAQHWLERVGLKEYGARYPHQLSGGQQQRVAIARALALEPELVLLDEVTSALDPELTGEVLGVMRDLAAAGTTMLVVSHEMSFVREVADEVAFMRDGRIVDIGPPATLFSQSPAVTAFLDRFAHTVPRASAPAAL